MSDDLIKSVQDLIDAGKGNRGRLQYIVEALKEGKSLYSSDQQYIERLLKQSSKTEENIEPLKREIKNEYDVQENLENTQVDKHESIDHMIQDVNTLRTDAKYNSNEPKRSMASIILGIIGGLIAIAVGIFAFFVGSIASIFGSSEAELFTGPLTALSFGAGTLGIVGGAIGKKVGGILMIIASVLALLGGGLFGILPFILLVVGGVLALKQTGSKKKRNFETELEGIGKTKNTVNNEPIIPSDKKVKLSIKKKVGIGLGIFFGIMIILGAISSSYVPNIDKTNEQGGAQPQLKSLGEKDNPAKVGDTIVIGDIAYKVTDTGTTHNLGGETFGENADGVFIVVDMEIENKGKKSEQLISNYFKLIDSQGREFETDNEAWIHLENNVFLKQLQPSLPTNGQIVFDVPTTTESYTLEISEIFSYDKKYIILGKYPT